MSNAANEPTIYAGCARHLIEYGARRGLDPGELLRIAGEPMEALSVPGAHIPLARACALIEYLARQLDDAGVPFDVARQARMEDLHVMGFAVMTATDGLEATRRAVRYARLISTSARWQLLEGFDESTIRFDRDLTDTLGHRIANESAVANFVQCSRLCVGDHYTPVRVTFRHRAPRDTRPHREFFGCPVEFSAAHDEFTVNSDFFRLSPRDAHPALSQFFRDHAETLLQAREIALSFADQVRREIARQLPSGQPALATVAARLATSERSLRRRLAADHTSFSQLLDQVRFERARSLLQSSEVALGEIAYLLGFSNVSAFSRAFKKWCGSAPGAFRAAAS